MQQKRLILTALFSALIIVGSYIRFPLPPVPITLQTLFVLLAGFLTGSRMALFSVAIYLLLGFVGLPVFSGGGGIGYLLGPTGGFLVGLLPAAVIAGFAGNYRKKEEKGTRYLLLSAITGLAATLVLYGCGVSWLKARGSLSWRAAIQIALLPFLIGDAVKLIVALRLAISFKGRIARFIDPTLA
ncbi:MAG TPA: biotin transporter BioY [Sphaerochaeta sp.]|nr:biotin transporter BioY [Sphaerochaeta sp.]